MGRGDEPAGLSAPKDTVQSAKTDVSMSEASTADLVLDEISCEDPEKKNTNALLMLLIVMIFNTGAHHAAEDPAFMLCTVFQFVMAWLGNSLAVLGDAICAVSARSQSQSADGVCQVVDCTTYVFNLVAEKYAK